MAFDTETIIQVANELRDAQAQVRRLELKLRNLVATGESNARGSVPISSLGLQGLMQPGLMAESTLPDKVIELLNANPAHVFSFGEISEVITGNDQYLRSTLARLIKEERIYSKGWGKYASVKSVDNLEEFDSLKTNPKTR